MFIREIRTGDGMYNMMTIVITGVVYLKAESKS